MNSYRPIVLATDGSPSAGEARRQAFDLAKASHAPLLVVSVSHATVPAVGYSAYGYSEIVTELTHAEHQRLDALLAEVTEAAAQEGIETTGVKADGPIVEEICRIAEENQAQLIVVGSHGWGAARRFLSGSVSTGLVHSAPCPVLVVRRKPDGEHERAAA